MEKQYYRVIVTKAQLDYQTAPVVEWIDMPGSTIQEAKAKLDEMRAKYNSKDYFVGLKMLS